MSSSGPSKISFGFKAKVPNLGSGSKPEQKTPLQSKSGAFGADDDDEDDNNLPTQAKKGKPSHPIASAPASKSSRNRISQAISTDSNVYEYDSIYDSLKSSSQKPTISDEPRQAKYIQGMLNSVSERNKLLLRASMKKTQREREAEGTEFEDKEEFVTDAYRQQQEELQRNEEKERKDEEQNRQSGGMASFYKDLMNQQDKDHQDAVANAERVQKNQRKEDDEIEEQESKKSAADQFVSNAKEKGLNVQLNDEGQLVDQRSLLSAGLNVLNNSSNRSSKPRNQPSTSSQNNSSRNRDHLNSNSRQESRQRSSQAIESQILEIERQREQEEVQRQQERKRKLMGERNSTSSNEDKAAAARKRMEERKKRKV
ncbi:unnamed protein product [Sympodiomycopsis kandeliae]